MKVVSKENVILKYNVVQDYPKKGVVFYNVGMTENKEVFSVFDVGEL